ncbi:MAG: response regulator [Gammaproteobacteria bacterium]|nr:response regulator [Gammaproteobacteria bacterium]
MHELMIVDDDENILKALSRVLSKNKKFSIETYSDPDYALKCAIKKKYDLIISDYRMPIMNGLSFLSTAKKIQPNAMRMILSGHADIEILMSAINEIEIFRFITKPWNDKDLINSVNQALEFKDTISENIKLADIVRQQRAKISEQNKILEDYKTDHPELFKVEWDEDGSIIIDDLDDS